MLMDTLNTIARKKSWRSRKNEKRKRFNAEYEIRKESMPSEDDIVLKHPTNGSNIRIKDNGTIQLFAGKNLGLKISPSTNSIMFYGGVASFKTPKLHFYTDDNGLKWNYTPLNRALANPLTEIVTSRIYGTEALINSLTSPGTYIGNMGAPVTPATINAIKPFGFKGARIYEGIEEINMLKSVSAGIKEIAKNLKMPNQGGFN